MTGSVTWQVNARQRKLHMEEQTTPHDAAGCTTQPKDTASPVASTIRSVRLLQGEPSLDELLWLFWSSLLRPTRIRDHRCFVPKACCGCFWGRQFSWCANYCTCFTESQSNIAEFQQVFFFLAIVTTIQGKFTRRIDYCVISLQDYDHNAWQAMSPLPILV